MAPSLNSTLTSSSSLHLARTTPSSSKYYTKQAHNTFCPGHVKEEYTYAACCRWYCTEFHDPRRTLTIDGFQPPCPSCRRCASIRSLVNSTFSPISNCKPTTISATRHSLTILCVCVSYATHFINGYQYQGRLLRRLLDLLGGALAGL